MPGFLITHSTTWNPQHRQAQSLPFLSNFSKKDWIQGIWCWIPLEKQKVILKAIHSAGKMAEGREEECWVLVQHVQPYITNLEIITMHIRVPGCLLCTCCRQPARTYLLWVALPRSRLGREQEPGSRLKRGSNKSVEQMSHQKLEQENLQSKKMKRWLSLETQSWTGGLNETCEEQTQRNSFQIWYSTKTQQKKNYSDMEKNLQIENTINVLKLNSFLM